MASFCKLVSAAFLLAAGTAIVGAWTTETGDTRVPVLLELFTSEGCSSCPPADKLLETLDRTQPIAGANLIVLSEHVDYWNNGGWKDPFSSAQNSARQSEYARKFNLESVYTPQLVVDGKAELVGSGAAEARAAIERAMSIKKSTVGIGQPVQSAGHVTVHIDTAPCKGVNAALYVALADNQTHSQVAGGENSGRLLTHVAVVHTLTLVGIVPAGSAFIQDVVLPLQRGVGANGLRIVAFVQDRTTGQVLSVAQRKL